MATQKGVWNLQQVRDKQLQSLWSYTGAGELWGWGWNENGSLGQNSRTYYSSPVQVPGTTWDKVGLSGKSTLATKTDGTLWGWGNNEQGQLGQNESYPGKNYSSPVQIPGTTWGSFAHPLSGDSNMSYMMFKTDGTLWVWGKNHRGALGQNNAYPGTRYGYSSPVQLPGTDWSTISTSSMHSIGVKTNGEMWLWGDNYKGALAQNNETNYSSPVEIPGGVNTWVRGYATYDDASYGIKTDGTLWSWGHNRATLGLNSNVDYSSPVQVPGTTWDSSDNKFSNVYQHAAAIKTDGTLWSWGGNDNGELGHNEQGSDISSPKQVGSDTTWSEVETSNTTTYATKTDGTLWGFGKNNTGELGLNNAVAYSSPTQIPGDFPSVVGAGNRHVSYRVNA